MKKQNNSDNFEIVLFILMGIAIMLFIFVNGPW